MDDQRCHPQSHVAGMAEKTQIQFCCLEIKDDDADVQVETASFHCVLAFLLSSVS